MVAHILDSIRGYSNRELRLGRDIAADTVQRLGDNGEVFIIVTYKDGVPTPTVRRRVDWLRAEAQQQVLDEKPDLSVWRAREEVKIC